MVDPITLILIAAGGAAGGIARHTISAAMTGRLGPEFPWGTLAVNLSGALLIGIAAALSKGTANPLYWQLGVIGFLGSYTTVSSFSLQTLTLFHAGRTRRALANIALSVGFGLSAAALGFWIAS